MEKSQNKNLTGLKKRQQIKAANKTVFMWVIIAAAVIGIASVASEFLLRQFFFNMEVIGQKQETERILKDNLVTYGELRKNIEKLIANENLGVLKKGDNSNALQVIIDSLPTEDNQAAFAASMQSEVLSRSGVVIDGFGVGAGSSGSDAGVIPTTSTAQQMPFNFSITGQYAQVIQALRDIERSVRPIDIQQLKLEGNDQSLKATISAVTYYQPTKHVKIEKVKKDPNEAK